MSGLDCIYCHNLYPGFDELAAHTKECPSRYVELPAPTGRRKLSFPERSPRRMAKKKTASKFPAPPESKRSTSNAGDERNPFLKAEHVGPAGTIATVKIVKDSARTGTSAFGSGEQVIVTVTHKEKAYDFGMDPTKPNYRILYDAKGDPSKWAGMFDLKVLSGNADYLAVQRIK